MTWRRLTIGTRLWPAGYPPCVPVFGHCSFLFYVPEACPPSVFRTLSSPFSRFPFPASSTLPSFVPLFCSSLLSSPRLHSPRVSDFAPSSRWLKRFRGRFPSLETRYGHHLRTSQTPKVNCAKASGGGGLGFILKYATVCTAAAHDAHNLEWRPVCGLGLQSRHGQAISRR